MPRNIRGFRCTHAAMTGILPSAWNLPGWLVEHKDQLCGKFKLIFQPAEEGVRGARAMCEAGIVDDVDYFFQAVMSAVSSVLGKLP